MTALYLGVDGGGSKTEFVCIDADRQVRARAVTGTTYHLQIGVEGALARLRDGLDAVCSQAGITPGDLRHCFFGLPAFGEDATVDPILEKGCGQLLGHDRYACGNDMICGWAGSLAGEDGINIVSGTGSIGYGERSGRAARAGGWGEIVSDEGSGYWIALRGLNAFTRMSDGRLPKGPLHAMLAEALSLREDLDLCARIMGEGALGRNEVAALSTVVARAADANDVVASAILHDAADELFRIANALRTQLGYEDEERTLLSWSGGILANGGAVPSRLTALVERDGRFDLVMPRLSPGVGAALYAMKKAAPTV